jgi:glycogen operon protein
VSAGPDLVSYDRKHNEGNGEGNRDGSDDNRSWNCGVEGPSDDPAVERLRGRQIRNMLTVTLLSLGMPMLLMGDEVRRTQRGNNNAYCQDDEIGWFDWTLLERHADVLRFVSLLNAARSLRGGDPDQRRTDLVELLAQGREAWHGIRLDRPDWSDSSHTISLEGRFGAGPPFQLLLNAYWEPLDFELPDPGDGAAWRRWIDTARESPEDIVPWEAAPPVVGRTYRVEARSVVVLFVPLAAQ